MNGKTRLLWLLFTINNYFTFLVVFADLCSGTCTKIYMTALSKCCRTLHNYTCFGHICQSLWMNICHNVFVQWKNIKPSQIFWAFKRVDLRYELHFRAFGWKSNFPIESLWFMQNRCKWKNIYEVNTHPKVFTLQVKQAKRRPAFKTTSKVCCTELKRFVTENIQSWRKTTFVKCIYCACGFPVSDVDRIVQSYKPKTEEEKLASGERKSEQTGQNVFAI